MRHADGKTGTHEHAIGIELDWRVEIQRCIRDCNHEFVIQYGSGRAGSRIQVKPSTVVTTSHWVTQSTALM